MANEDDVKTQEAVLEAEFVTPPNILKRKMGSGGIDPKALTSAQTFFENNTVDFKPIAVALVNALDQGVQFAKERGAAGEASIEAMLAPAAQLKAQGIMFHYPLVTRIANILVDFLEKVDVADKDVLEIVEAHKVAVSFVLRNNITDEGGARGKSLQSSLGDACRRYFKARNL